MNNINFSIQELNYENRIGNLTNKASGVVKNNKFFPIYKIDNKNYIFKPLSKTKPLTTPLFSYAEVIWSNIINTYFCEAPLYQLAKCIGYTNEEQKYYEYGCLVPNVLSENEHLVNLLEYFKENRDKEVNIDDYINYCLLFYDYIPIFKSKLIKENSKLGNDLALQVLLSILKGDQNFHYENVAFICDKDNNILRLAPMIDHEFSTMFLFLDKLIYNMIYFDKFIKDIKNKDSIIFNNINYITKNYPNVVIQFKIGLEKLLQDINNLYLQDNGFLWECNTNNYKIGIARYKENNEEKAKKLENEILNNKLDLIDLNSIIVNEIKKTIETLLLVLN